MKATWPTLSPFAIFLFTLASPAQTIAVSGDVRSDAGAPITQTKIRIEGTGSSTLSNDQGHFDLVVPESLANRTITVSARIIGYSSSRLLVPMSDSSTHRSFALEGCALGYWNPGEPAERFAPIPSSATIALASGLNELKEARYAAAPEVRVWIWRSAEIPFDLFRFMVDRTAKTGEHISSTWSTHRCMHEARYDDLCGRASLTGTQPNIGHLFICRSVDPAAADWSTRWAIIESADARELLRAGGRYDSRDRKRNPHFLTIESWDGNRYRVGSYALPDGADSSVRTPAERLAARLQKVP